MSVHSKLSVQGTLRSHHDLSKRHGPRRLRHRIRLDYLPPDNLPLIINVILIHTYCVCSIHSLHITHYSLGANMNTAGGIKWLQIDDVIRKDQSFEDEG